MTKNNGPWPLVPFGELTVNHDGVRVPVKEADRKPGPYPYYGASGIVDWVDGYLFDGDYVLIAEDGENLRTRRTPVAFMAGGKFWVNNHAHIVQGNARADTRYLMYALSQADVGAYLTGSTMPKLTQGNLNRIPIPAPSKPEQEAIARVLGSLDDKIELNGRMTDTLEAMSRALFRSWFVDFDPVRARAEGRSQYGIDPSIAALFPKEFVESRLGPIPMGWRVGHLDEVAEIVMGSSPPGESYNEAGIGTPLVNGPVEFGNYFTVKQKWTTQPVKLSQPNDLVFCVRGSTTGRRVVADDVYCLGRGVCAMRARGGAWAFIHRLVDFSLDRMLSRVSGSVFPNLNGPDLKQFEIVIPNERLIAEFQHRVEPWLNMIGVKVRESESLADLRNGLLPKLLSGELKVA